MATKDDKPAAPATQAEAAAAAQAVDAATAAVEKAHATAVTPASETATARALVEMEKASDAALAAAKDARDDDHARLCPACHGELIRHGPENPYKAGCSHCNTCGACWLPGLREQRPGHGGPLAAEAH